MITVVICVKTATALLTAKSQILMAVKVNLIMNSVDNWLELNKIDIIYKYIYIFLTHIEDTRQIRMKNPICDNLVSSQLRGGFDIFKRP